MGIPDFNLAPEVGFEPTTNRLTADRSTTELLWIVIPSIDEAVKCLRARKRQVFSNARGAIRAEIGCGGGI